VIPLWHVSYRCSAVACNTNCSTLPSLAAHSVKTNEFRRDEMGDLNAPWCGVAVSDGGRYQLKTTGLRIMDITPSDSGEYRCVGAIETAGIYDSRPITVHVHSAGKAAFTLMHRPKYKLLKIMVHSHTHTHTHTHTHAALEWDGLRW